jgi:hypothetical protein
LSQREFEDGDDVAQDEHKGKRRGVDEVGGGMGWERNEVMR